MLEKILSVLALTQQNLIFNITPVTESSKLVVSCQYGHCYVTNWLLLQRGVHCQTCQGQIKYEKEDIATTCGLFGYELLSESYENNKQKLSFRCENGHIFDMTWLNLSQGHRCPMCMKNKILIEDIISFASENGHTLETKEYKNNKQVLEF